MTNPTPNQEERFNLNDMIDRLSLVIDIACTIQHRRNDLSELIASGDIDSILAILSPKYTISGLAIDTSLVTQSLNTIAKAGWVFQPHLNPIVARIAQLLLIRRSWAAKAYKVGGAALGSLVVILLCVHFIQGARYASWVKDVSTTGATASALRQDAELCARQAAQISGTPAGARLHAVAALAAVGEVDHDLSQLQVFSDDPAALESAYESSHGDTRKIVADDNLKIDDAKAQLQRAKSEVALAQQVLEFAQKWSSTTSPVDLPLGLSATWVNVTNTLRADITSGDLSSITKADERLAFILSAAHQEADALAIVKVLPDSAREQATLQVSGIDDDVAANDPAAVALIMSKIHVMQSQTDLSYTVQLIVKPGMKSGVERAIAGQSSTARYYLLAQAVDGSGKPLAVPVVDSETNAAQSVQDFGVEVAKDVYDAIAARKAAGESSISLGHKATGSASPTYDIPVLPGLITHW